MSSSQPLSHQKTQREISIFWDYENVPLPVGYSATVAAKAIVDAVSSYGRIVDRRLYYDFERHNINNGSSIGRPRDSSGLDSSGFDLVNTPTRNQKETLDKKLIADILVFAWDSAVRNDNTKPCVVLLTSDGDYAYTLAKLRDRGVMTVVMVGTNCTVASILLNTADVALKLEEDVLCGEQTNRVELSSSSAVENHPSELRQQKSTNKQLMRSSSSTSNEEKNKRKEPFVLSLCRIVHQIQSDDGWVDLGSVASRLQQVLRRDLPSIVDVKETFKEVRKQAELQELVETGRRVLDQNYSNARYPQGGPKRRIVTYTDPGLKLSNEVYVRILPKGEALLMGQPHQTLTNKNTPIVPASPNPKWSPYIYMRLPFGVLVQQLVQFLENTYPVTIQRALIEFPQTGKTHSCNAHVEFIKTEHATLLISEANKTTGGKGVYYEGRSVGITVNKRSGVLNSRGNENVYYERQDTAPVLNPERNTTGERQEPNCGESNDDKIWICLSIKKGQSDQSSWVSGGTVGVSFRSLLLNNFTISGSKEELSARFKSARDSAITEGLIEMGRRRLDSEPGNYEFVPVPLTKSTPTNFGVPLSPETYLRLLPSGHALLQEAQPPNDALTMANVERTKFVVADSSIPQRFVFVKNFPTLTDTKHVVLFFETTFDCSVERVELEERTWDRSPCITAHIQFASPDQASRIVDRSDTRGLIYRGNRIIAVLDRTTPDDIASKYDSRCPEMTFTKEIQQEEVLDNNATNEIIIGDVTFDSTTADEQAVDTIMSSPITSHKDPFEDLLW